MGSGSCVLSKLLVVPLYSEFRLIDWNRGDPRPMTAAPTMTGPEFGVPDVSLPNLHGQGCSAVGNSPRQDNSVSNSARVPETYSHVHATDNLTTQIQRQDILAALLLDVLMKLEQVRRARQTGMQPEETLLQLSVLEQRLEIRKEELEAMGARDRLPRFAFCPGCREMIEVAPQDRGVGCAACLGVFTLSTGRRIGEVINTRGELRVVLHESSEDDFEDDQSHDPLAL